MDTANSGPLASLIEADAPAPSQQVTYEMPDAQEYRAKMSKKMGTRLMDDSIGTRVESPGLVRDVDASGGTGVGGRLRKKNNQDTSIWEAGDVVVCSYTKVLEYKATR
ncbi:hypothetical protein D6D17_03721 [Aureobasidium pullulans]|nr:hypothetical protein D6D17_03721 [Aureobasidium pullulans]